MIDSINPVIMVFIIGSCVSILLAVLQKVLVNQDQMRNLNKQLKDLNKEFKEAQKNKNQKEIMKLQPKMMEINSKKMSNSMKPMMVSFLVIIPIFIFVLPGLYGDVVVELNDSLEGTVNYEGHEKDVRVVEEPFKIEVNGEEMNKIELGDKEFVLKNYNKDEKKLELKMVVVEMPFSLPIWGTQIGWLGWYILVSLTTSTVFRKALGVVN